MPIKSFCKQLSKIFQSYLNMCYINIPKIKKYCESKEITISLTKKSAEFENTKAFEVTFVLEYEGGFSINNKADLKPNLKLQATTQFIKGLTYLISFVERNFDGEYGKNVANKNIIICTFDEMLNYYLSHKSKWPVPTFDDYIASEHKNLSNYDQKSLFENDETEILTDIYRRPSLLEGSPTLLKEIESLVFESWLDHYIPNNFEGYAEFQESLKACIRFIEDLRLKYPKALNSSKFSANGVDSEKNLASFATKIQLKYFDAFLQAYFAKQLNAARNVVNFQNYWGNLETISSVKGFKQTPSTSPISDKLSKSSSLSKYRELLEDFHIEEFLGTNPFTYPDCQISTNIQQFCQLLNDLAFDLKDQDFQTLQELGEKMGEKNDLTPLFRSEYVRQNQRTLNDAVEIFLALADPTNNAEIHGHPDTILKMLDVPLYSIIYLNDCLYLAYRIMLLEASLLSKFTSSAMPIEDKIRNPLLEIASSVYKLMANGCNFFYTSQLKGVQAKTIKDYIQEYFDIPATEGETSFVHNDKSLRKCSVHLKNLKKVFAANLPTGIWQRSLGLLMDLLFEQIIFTVLKMEDITSDCCDAFASHFTTVLIQDLIPDLFAHQETGEKPLENGEPSSILFSRTIAKYGQYISSLPKFIGLIEILTSPMVEIADDWLRANKTAPNTRKPPIGQFSADELRSLIRALFQNTEMRKNVLDKIK